MGFSFELHHISGEKMEQIGPDILSRSMLPLDNKPHDIWARKLEKPVLKLNHNFSPFLSSWFSIEHAHKSYFDENQNLIINDETLGYMEPSKEGYPVTRKEEKLYGCLRKMLKNKDDENKMQKTNKTGIFLISPHVRHREHANMRVQNYAYGLAMFLNNLLGQACQYNSAQP